MPATATHAFFAEDLYEKFDKTTKKNINSNKKLLLTFAQNTDPLMFYNIINLVNGKEIRNLQHKSHCNKTNEFFYNLITYVKTNKYYNDPKVLIFIYGFIAHFTLDSIAHPYIIYKTGIYNKKDKSTLKYNCKHHDMETFIDNIMIDNKTKINYKKFNVAKYTIDLEKFSATLNDVIDYTFYKTFNIKNMSKIYYKSLKHMNIFLRLFRKDSYGIKKKCYKLIDSITPKTTFRLESLSYYQSLKDTNDYLNNNHKKWNYPVDINITSNKSFFDIYNEALDEAITIISEVNKYFYKDKKIDINKLFKNKGYTTGIDCNSSKKQKYFEY